MKRILVLCTGNSARSQMAEGYLQTFADMSDHGDRADPVDALLSFRQVRDQIKAYCLEFVENHFVETIVRNQG